ncbi:isoamyl acetate-hydrolyzing esterase [Entomophthora muscae]|uniref:Isoamyl acetate-hydrolyzing esterase n=1 Tax=Entomophthora muscae TaxID=34485 RepID=A0ACC2U164_9FUNG|nr:isoamyl acetate-hydrolyzing esterase [Entomophthora muscae]
MGLFPKLFFIGDSLTEYGAILLNKGWVAQLRELYSLKADLIARGFSGYNTEWLKPIFTRVVTEELSSGDEIRIITILLGSNDACLSHREQHIPLQKYTENLVNMIEAIKEVSSDVHIFLVTPPPMNEAAYEAHERQFGVTEPGRANVHVRQYADAVIPLSDEKKVHVIDLWEGFSPKAELFSDGLHLSEKGNTLLAHKWLEGVRTHCPHLSPENLPLITPHWSEMKKVEF